MKLDEWQKEFNSLSEKHPISGIKQWQGVNPAWRTMADEERLAQLRNIGLQNGWVREDGGFVGGLKDAFLNPAVLSAAGGMALQAGGVSAFGGGAGGAAGTAGAGSAGVGAGVGAGTVGAGTAGIGAGVGVGAGAAAGGTAASWAVPAAIAGSSALGFFGAQKAAEIQAESARESGRVVEHMYDQNRADLSPWRTSGATANATLAGMLDPKTGSLLKPFKMDDLTNEPGYQFGLSEGEKGINRAAAAGSGRYSGATLKALTRFNEDYAGTKYDAAFNRDASTKNQQYTMLSGVSNTGANAAGMTAGIGANAANTQANLITGAGNANAAGVVGGANAVSGGVSNWLNYDQQQKFLTMLGQGRGTGTTPYTMQPNV